MIAQHTYPPSRTLPQYKSTEGIERSQQLRGDRSGAIGAEVGNIVASIGRIDRKEIEFTFLTIRTRLTIAKQYTSATMHDHADKSPETPPTD